MGKKRTVLQPYGKWAKTSPKFLIVKLHSSVWIPVFQAKTDKTASTELGMSCLNHWESLYDLVWGPSIWVACNYIKHLSFFIIQNAKVALLQCASSVTRFVPKINTSVFQVYMLQVALYFCQQLQSCVVRREGNLREHPQMSCGWKCPWWRKLQTHNFWCHISGLCPTSAFAAIGD